MSISECVRGHLRWIQNESCEKSCDLPGARQDWDPRPRGPISECARVDLRKSAFANYAKTCGSIEELRYTGPKVLRSVTVNGSPLFITSNRFNSGCDLLELLCIKTYRVILCAFLLNEI